ncbi:MAG: hypothetical protein COW00_03470 [Bdellovibrio sp. CG12_big_fil_rev_8_21_14_0_65_39_13]|nr:MAG: hypothetical protein COW78_10875 [Bdellovibrio sp. CG22_combo_CG10-13_8_21_14_all_39_27]PIQ61636.1 MAG: hypothetical protein COW00_03470 [Bdellovibrio sp. CG12_big_fil_rev_8_21_14_0_65_39_13]PIR35699.1 MAG: hypothetical protein COV37_07265 [Bdellovibrio sp. CG11_big_fil_rev_8_21_14_0_20_39_38]PJB54514.1 MAG: hypothetical protein CO099_01180 [Bdellovibrio sp. CG_4_9_14_3_um_filter_39_7]
MINKVAGSHDREASLKLSKIRTHETMILSNYLQGSDAMKKLFLCLAMIIILSPNAYATDRRSRLGVGYTNQLINNLPAISFKLQRSKAFALGGLVGYSNARTGGGHGAGLKFYRNIFDEPQLNFYTALMAALLSQKNPGADKSGFQVDATLGTEFHFSGLSSIAFSVEFGMSFNKINDFVIETVGNNFLVAGVHFYL